MAPKHRRIGMALAMIVAAPPAWAMGAGAGCADLPDYARAQGALQGMTGACDMSVEEARRIVAAQGGQPATQPAPPPRHHRHRRTSHPPI